MNSAVIDGSIYTIGAHGFTYVEVDGHRIRSSRTVEEVEKAIEAQSNRSGRGRPSTASILLDYYREDESCLE